MDDVNTGLSQKTMSLKLSEFIQQLGDPYALIPEDNLKQLARVIEQQNKILKVVEILEQQELHKFISSRFSKMAEIDEIMTPERIESLGDKALVTYVKGVADVLIKSMALSQGGNRRSVVNNLFLGESEPKDESLKKGMTADERTAVKMALEKFVTRVAAAEAEIVSTDPLEDTDLGKELFNV